MKKEEKYLVEICKAYLCGEAFCIDEEIDYTSLFRLAKAHNLGAVCRCVFAKAENADKIPQKCADSFLDNFFDCIFMSEKQSECIKELEAVFTASCTPYTFFKGAVLRELYPVPETRVMGDIDVLISKADRNKVKKLLTDSGFVCTAQNGPVFDYRKGNVLVEVHTRIINEKGFEDFPNPFDYISFDGFRGSLDDNYFFAYLIAHTAHHFKFYGAGIKLILDLAVMQNKKNIRFDKVMDILDTVGLTRFAKEILSVCSKWFSAGECYINNTQKTEEFLCSYGAFGNINRNKGAVIVRKDIETGKTYSPFTVRLRLAFPSYEKMKEIPYIRFIDGRPWLTPYAWCYRFFFNIKNRKSLLTKAVKSLGDEETAVQAYEEIEYFKEIGLL